MRLRIYRRRLSLALYNDNLNLQPFHTFQQKKNGGETIVMKYKEWMLCDEYLINLKIGCFLCLSCVWLAMVSKWMT